MPISRKAAKDLLFNGKDCHPIPGVYDGISALALQSIPGAQFAVVSGYSLAASLLGVPDIGVLSQADVIATAFRICAVAKNLSIIIDGDTGYGGPNNVKYLVQALEKAGALGVMLEDQVWPKKCGHMEGKNVILMEEHIHTIIAAVKSRTDPDFIIMARTDARGVNGLEDAIIRAKAYQAAGADIIFVEAPQSREELKQIADDLKGVPLIANMLEGGKTPVLTSQELLKMGYKMAYYPLQPIYAATKAMQITYANLVANRNGRIGSADGVSFTTFNQLVGLNEANEFADEIKNSAKKVSSKSRISKL